MFDTQYNTGLNGSCGLAGLCTDYHRDADRHEAITRSYQNEINSFYREMDGLKNGTAQKEYELLESQQVSNRNEIATLKGEIEKARQKLKSWQLNPEVANALGFWNISSCTSEKNRRDRTHQDMKVKEAERDGVRRELNILKEKFSPEVMQKIRDAANSLANEVTSLRSELAKINKEIDETKKLYLARKEAERLALEQEKQAREKAATPNQNNNNNTIWIFFAMAVGGYFLLNNNKTIVKVKG
ncbi:hypothetical protein [Capnocytophaga catalasegens]|uniref:Mobilization protein n=1 Tax=Capnocytophaga catalasegens TaxID=1004260 RepID=A0AAV5AW98_9FLAO|nr:hypothetical protein [Capnocytophaga catalasegens]GIZ16211.1 hypothetical protein RCZ03_22110 [Capnocytophaga catalasegens]GJM51644.1 hypothetical protein RCZ15_26170 [Capnocytophaga catalasegens]GJM54334.1 hypothetical protein RCZ16_26500 [Capnocytophaga catalasegens]